MLVKNGMVGRSEHHYWSIHWIVKVILTYLANCWGRSNCTKFLQYWISMVDLCCALFLAMKLTVSLSSMPCSAKANKQFKKVVTNPTPYWMWNGKQYSLKNTQSQPCYTKGTHAYLCRHRLFQSITSCLQSHETI